MNLSFIILAIAPVLAVCGYIFHKDRFNKQPIKLVIIAFIFGVFSFFPTAVATKLGGAFIVNNGNLLNTSLFAFLVLSLSEEFAKFFFLRYILFNRKEFTEPLDAVVYALILGFGFAAFENFLYVVQYGNKVSIMLMLTTILAHTILAILMSYYVGLAKFDITHKYELLRKGLVYPVLLHGLYAFFLLQNFMAGILILAAVGLWFSVKYIRYILTQPKNNLPFL